MFPARSMALFFCSTSIAGTKVVLTSLPLRLLPFAYALQRRLQEIALISITRAVLTAACGLALAPFAAASMFLTAPGTTIAGSGPVNAQATFDFSNGSLTITLQNLQGDMANAGQLLSGLDFTVAGAASGSSLASSSAQLITVTGPGNGTTGTTGGTGWAFGTFSNAMIVCDICPATSSAARPGGGPPFHTIIGPGPFSNPNASLTGNHNPFLNQSAVFVIDNASFTPGSTVSHAEFFFGTDPTKPPVGGEAVVPEPASVMLSGAGLLGFGIFGMRKRKRT